MNILQDVNDIGRSPYLGAVLYNLSVYISVKMVRNYMLN